MEDLSNPTKKLITSNLFDFILVEYPATCCGDENLSKNHINQLIYISNTLCTIENWTFGFKSLQL